MKEIYVIRICGKCKKTNILINDEVEDTIKKGKYISCSHCGSIKLKEEKATNSIRECMGHSAYKKVHGAVRQVRQE